MSTISHPVPRVRRPLRPPEALSLRKHSPGVGKRRPLALVVDTLRGHWVSALVWVIAGGLGMFGMAVAVAAEMKDFPGGAQALAAGIGPSAEALRVMRWPAERLDTLGGYVTYHNVILFNFFLALYGAVQGARAIRRGEERHLVEELLATGTSRVAVVRDRAIGFAVTMLAISLALGLWTAAGLAVGGEPDLGGSLISLGTAGLVGMVGYALGLLASQLLGSARAAAGVSAALVTALYVGTNVWDQLGAVGEVLRYGSPFYYASLSRALVPGHGLDLGGTAALLGMTVGLVALAAWAFARRDYASPLWSRRARSTTGARPARVPTAMLSSVWMATLRQRRFGLLAWGLSTAVLIGLMASLQPAVMKVWSVFDFMGTLAGGPGITPETAYWSFTGTILAPVITAYVIAQASGWVADLEQGRVELILGGPTSWTQLVVERLVALAAGVAAITVGGLGALVLGTVAVGSSLELAGLGRLAVAGVVFGGALGGLAAVAVAWLRRGSAVIALACVIGASYVLGYFVPIFHWPEWLNRLSVFWAFGRPYLEWPPVSALVVLLVLALPGAVLAARIAERTPKVA